MIKIDQVRAVGDFISLSTHRAGHRVLVIHPAEAMQPAGANALLKTLEEPPPNTLIVLVSDRPARLLPTIVSRPSAKSRIPSPRASVGYVTTSGMRCRRMSVTTEITKATPSRIHSTS